MEHLKDEKKITFISLLGLIGLLLVTIGVTFAFFNYTKLGSTENLITTGTIKLIYTENECVGKGIKMENALPVSDEIGKVYSTENYVFDFKVEGTTKSVNDLPYEVTARMSDNSTLDSSLVKIYLVEFNGDSEVPSTQTLSNGVIKTYDELTQTSYVSEDYILEKTIYKGFIPADSDSYIANFRLRMWIREDADFSNQSNNNQTFIVTVNVYSNL